MNNDPKLLVVAPVSVRWGDMDAFGHVNNSVFATYLEEARLRWFATIEGGWYDASAAPVVAAQSFNFRQPIEWPADIQIELFVNRMGNSSMTIGHRIVDSQDATRIHCDGSITMVWIDTRSGRPVPLPQALRDAVADATRA